MKRISTRILAMLLACALICALAGCTTSPLSSDTSKPFSRGTVSGSDYTSDYIGLTFHAPDGWSYYTDSQISSLLNVTASYLEDPASFEKATEGELIDFFCSTADGSNNVDLSFTKSPGFVSLENSINTTVDYIKGVYEQMGLGGCTASEPADRTLCGRTYKTVTLDVGGILTQYFYMTQIGDYVVAISGTFTDGTTATQFEAMFS